MPKGSPAAREVAKQGLGNAPTEGRLLRQDPSQYPCHLHTPQSLRISTQKIDSGQNNNYFFNYWKTTLESEGLCPNMQSRGTLKASTLCRQEKLIPLDGLRAI